PAVSLSEFFKPGVVFQDRNGDGAVDFVNARIVLPENPTASELSAAADVAARLGFETSAMDLPVVRLMRDAVRLKPDTTGVPGAAASTQTSVGSGFSRTAPTQSPVVSGFSRTAPAIFIGARSLTGTGVTPSALGGATLRAGEGVVAAFSWSGQPAIALLGDDDGLEAAAVMLGGRLPYVWDQKSANIATLAGEAREYLNAKGITAVSSVTSAVTVRRGAGGVERALVDLQMAKSGDVIKAQVALNHLKATGSRDAKRALSFANLRTLAVRLRAAGTVPVTVDLPRPPTTDAAAQPPGRRPGGGAKDNFDLSTFYTNDGALADSDNNLIPDRVDVVLSPEGDGTGGIVDLAARL